MNRSTTHDQPKSDRSALSTLANMPDWLIMLLIVLLALAVLGTSLYVW